MQLTCDFCGETFERPAYIANRRDRSHAHAYCSKLCTQAAQREARRTDEVQRVWWLNAADSNDEKYLVNRIVQTTMEMRRYDLFSPEWELLSERHSTLLDVARDIFRIHGKYAPDGDIDNSYTYGKEDGEQSRTSPR